jgi:UDP-N-acetylmuramyl pentapeptide synthase
MDRDARAAHRTGAREADVVLVAVHWGDNLETVPSRAEIAVGHAIVDAGADAILGTSAHVLQGIEVYRGRPIIHDAGDLLFDAMRGDAWNAGIFSLTLHAHGVERVQFTPIRVDFGFSEPYEGDRARAASEHFAAQCRALGTQVFPTPEGGCVLHLAPPVREVLPQQPLQPATSDAAVARPASPPLRTARPGWVVDAVPADAAMPPLKIGPLRLVGMRCMPNQVFGRQLLVGRVVLDSRCAGRGRPAAAVPRAAGAQQDHAGLGRRHGPRPLRLDVADQPLDARAHLPRPLRPAAAAHAPDGKRRAAARSAPARRARTARGAAASRVVRPAHARRADAAARDPRAGVVGQPAGREPRPGPVWTAEQLAQITGGQWLVPPPAGWSVQSVVRLPMHLKVRPGPALFVASDYRTLAAHENFSRAPEDWDQHDDLQRLHTQCAGAVVQHPVEGLPPDFPLLQVPDPIRALLSLGAAARARYKGLVVGVTGTVGKSSTIAMVRDLLPPGARVLTTVENNNSRVGVPGAMASLGPDVDVCILEMAQSALWMDRGPISLEARPHVAILTEVGLSQTAKTDTLEKTAEYKSRAFLGLEPGGIAVVSAHIPYLAKVVKAAMRTAAKVWTVGTGPNDNIRLLDARPESSGCRVRLSFKGRIHEYLFPVASIGLVRNSALAFAAIVAMGFDAEEASARMPHVRLPASVMQVEPLRTRSGALVTLVDDSWNAEVMSMRNAMSFVRSYRAPRQRAGRAQGRRARAHRQPGRAGRGDAPRAGRAAAGLGHRAPGDARRRDALAARRSAREPARPAFRRRGGTDPLPGRVPARRRPAAGEGRPRPLGLRHHSLAVEEAVTARCSCLSCGGTGALRSCCSR